jgi:MFS family permease
MPPVGAPRRPGARGAHLPVRPSGDPLTRYPAPVSVEPLQPVLDPLPPAPNELPRRALWRNGAFTRLWTAATISIFGSLLTRLALPLVAIYVLSAGPVEIALVRTMDLAAGLAVGLVAGAWVDRLRRRPVMIWADLGRAVLLGSIPVAAIAGWLSLAQLLVVALLAALLTTFFDVADRAYLPTIVSRSELVQANGALATSSSVSEFLAFGAAGFLVQALTGPLTIAIDAITYIVSALLLGSIRVKEPPPPPRADREPVLTEIRTGLRIVIRHPLLRSMTLAAMALGALSGVFGAIWFLFAIDELGLDAATIGMIAAIGGVSSFVGALVAYRSSDRIPLGYLLIASVALVSIGNLLMPLAPAGAPLLAVAFLVGQQLIADAGHTVFEITTVSVQQSVVDERQLGRVNATVDVALLLAQLVSTLAAGALALAIGLRATAFLAPLGGVAAMAILWASPVRRLRTVEDAPAVDLAD